MAGNKMICLDARGREPLDALFVFFRIKRAGLAMNQNNWFAVAGGKIYDQTRK